MALSLANALEVSLDYLLGSDKAMMIDDQEIIQRLGHYDRLKTAVKQNSKRFSRTLRYMIK
jgi:hypothetical protein